MSIANDEVLRIEEKMRKLEAELRTCQEEYKKVKNEEFKEALAAFLSEFKIRSTEDLSKAAHILRSTAESTAQAKEEPVARPRPAVDLQHLNIHVPHRTPVQQVEAPAHEESAEDKIEETAEEAETANEPAESKEPDVQETPTGSTPVETAPTEDVPEQAEETAEDLLVSADTLFDESDIDEAEAEEVPSEEPEVRAEEAPAPEAAEDASDLVEATDEADPFSVDDEEADEPGDAAAEKPAAEKEDDFDSNDATEVDDWSAFDNLGDDEISSFDQKKNNE